MTRARREAVTPSDVVTSVLRAAGPRLILVGGQALAFWMDRYKIPLPAELPYVSRDIDFLGESRGDVSEVQRLAGVLGGQAVIPHERTLTALVGQAIKDISEDEFINVDIVFRVLGAGDGLRARAVEVRHGDIAFKVMHPLDLLKSRLDNLHQLPEKQTDIGRAQLGAAIAVVQAFLKHIAEENPGQAGKRPTVLTFISLIERLALGDAGRKVADRHGLHVADAIVPELVASAEFRQKKLPQLTTLMSPARKMAVERLCRPRKPKNIE
jgi:hypothetical protein